MTRPSSIPDGRHPMVGHMYDIIGVGFGPANIALAITMEELGYLGSTLFLETHPGPAWQPGMLLSGADIQNHALRDLVTPRNPRSRFSFTNYLHEHGRLFTYLNLGLTFALRKDYAQYISWSASKFERIARYGIRVSAIEPDEEGRSWRVRTSDGRTLGARAIVLAPGRTPLIPETFRASLGPRAFHLVDYLPRIDALAARGEPDCVCVVGGSQSAVEIVLDLAQRFPRTRIVNLMRGFGYQLKDTSPFTGHVYFPEFVDYFFAASPASKLALAANLNRTNYSSADRDVIERLYATIYEQSLDGKPRLEVLANREVAQVRADGDRIALGVHEIHCGARATVEADAVVLATGFRNMGTRPQDEKLPPLLAPLADRLALDREGVLLVNRDYSVTSHRHDVLLPPIFLNGLCEASHGFGDAGSFSLLALRTQTIYRAVLDRLKPDAPAVRPVGEAIRTKGLAPATAVATGQTRNIARGRAWTT
jgi:L-ornithine N5-monooxygenase